MRSNGFVAILFVILLSSTVSSVSASNQQLASTPDQQLNSISELISSGQAKAAYQLATEYSSTFSEDIHFGIRLIETLATSTTKLNDKTYQPKIINIAIRAANRIEKSKVCDGQGEGEIAYRYMVAIGKLAERIESSNAAIASQLYLAAGRIATHLKTNPGYPQNAHEILSLPIMGKARAYALQGEQQAAFQAIQESFDLGFNDFELLENDKLLAKLDRTRFTKTVSDNLKRYQDKTALWAKQQIARFPKSDFSFDVEDVESGQLAKDDLHGSVVVVDLWATWCPPCREGIPHFIKLADHFDGSAVEVVGISMDSPHDPYSSLEKVRDFVDEKNINYPIGLGDQSISSQLTPEQKLPTTLFLDNVGKVRYSAEGFHNFYQLEALTNELLKETRHISSDDGM